MPSSRALYAVSRSQALVSQENSRNSSKNFSAVANLNKNSFASPPIQDTDPPIGILKPVASPNPDYSSTCPYEDSKTSLGSPTSSKLCDLSRVIVHPKNKKKRVRFVEEVPSSTDNTPSTGSQPSSAENLSNGTKLTNASRDETNSALTLPTAASKIRDISDSPASAIISSCESAQHESSQHVHHSTPSSPTSPVYLFSPPVSSSVRASSRIYDTSTDVSVRQILGSPVHSRVSAARLDSPPPRVVYSQGYRMLQRSTVSSYGPLCVSRNNDDHQYSLITSPETNLRRLLYLSSPESINRSIPEPIHSPRIPPHNYVNRFDGDLGHLRRDFQQQRLEVARRTWARICSNTPSSSSHSTRTARQVTSCAEIEQIPATNISNSLALSDTRVHNICSPTLDNPTENSTPEQSSRSSHETPNSSLTTRHPITESNLMSSNQSPRKSCTSNLESNPVQFSTSCTGMRNAIEISPPRLSTLHTFVDSPPTPVLSLSSAFDAVAANTCCSSHVPTHCSSLTSRNSPLSENNRTEGIECTDDTPCAISPGASDEPSGHSISSSTSSAISPGASDEPSGHSISSSTSSTISPEASDEPSGHSISSSTSSTISPEASDKPSEEMKISDITPITNMVSSISHQHKPIRKRRPRALSAISLYNKEGSYWGDVTILASRKSPGHHMKKPKMLRSALLSSSTVVPIDRDDELKNHQNDSCSLNMTNNPPISSHNSNHPSDKCSRDEHLNETSVQKSAPIRKDVVSSDKRLKKCSSGLKPKIIPMKKRPRRRASQREAREKYATRDAMLGTFPHRHQTGF